MAKRDALPRRGLMFILSSPSGAGKTTISRMLLEQEADLTLSVSVTTRPMRRGEVDGRDYFFTSPEKFEEMVANGAFLEWAEVFGNRYGTPRAQIAEGLEKGQDFLFDIDWQGAQQLSQSSGNDVVSVFLLPPSLEELERRLRGRGTDSDQVIAGRMAKAQSEIRHGMAMKEGRDIGKVQTEISHWDGYDYVLINDDVDLCLARVKTILHAERLKRRRQRGLVEFAHKLMR